MIPDSADRDEVLVEAHPRAPGFQVVSQPGRDIEIRSDGHGVLFLRVTEHELWLPGAIERAAANCRRTP